MDVTKVLRRMLVTLTAVVAIGSGLVWATTGSGTTSTLVGTAVFDAFKVERRYPSEWAVKVEAKQGLKVATQTITFNPGGRSGWHSHPGPVFISVKEGTMTFYEADCSRTVRTAGEGLLDVGDHPHIAVNESGAPATNVVTYFVPPDAAALRIDEPQPLTCSIQ